ncbi:hypothetical protein DMB37_34205 [Nocardia sp. CS682]|nr:hypothetical protein DMB37_34205 [Nocardia sp. CS682]
MVEIFLRDAGAQVLGEFVEEAADSQRAVLGLFKSGSDRHARSVKPAVRFGRATAGKRMHKTMRTPLSGN